MSKETGAGWRVGAGVVLGCVAGIALLWLGLGPKDGPDEVSGGAVATAPAPATDPAPGTAAVGSTAADAGPESATGAGTEAAAETAKPAAAGAATPAPTAEPETAQTGRAQSDPAQAASAQADDVQAAPAPAAPATGSAAGAPSGTADETAGAAANDAAGGAEEPTFDTVRADAEGGVQVSGRARPGAVVRLLAEGEEIGRATANGRGDFAVLAEVPTDGRPRDLTLSVDRADGSPLLSSRHVILAPRAATGLAAADGAGATGAVTGAEPAAGGTVAVADATTASTAAEAPAVLMAGPEGVSVVSGPAAQQVVIDVIGYDAGGAVSLSGRAGPGEGGEVRLYVDNALAATAPISADRSWSARLNDLAGGLYTLRVDEIDAGGQVASRFETPFQREAPETLAAALGTGASAPAAPVAPAAPPPAADSTAPAAPTGAAEPAPPGGAAPEQSVAATAAPAAPADAGATGGTVPQAGGLVQITVQPGYTLWAIAARNYGDPLQYLRLYEANRGQIRNPDLIYPGQVFTIPGRE